MGLRDGGSNPPHPILDEKDLLIKLHAYVSSDGIIDTWKSKDLHGGKIRIRKKFRVRFYNNHEKLINDFIDSVKTLYPAISVKFYSKRHEVEIRSQIVAKNLLELGEVSSRKWKVPRKMSNLQKAIWIKAFADCDGTVYNKKYNRYVAIDSINLDGLRNFK